MVHSAGRFVLSLALCYFVLVFFSPFSIAFISFGEERANLSAFRTFVRFALVWFCLFYLPLGVWEGLRLVIVALPGLFSYLFLEPQREMRKRSFRYVRPKKTQINLCICSLIRIIIVRRKKLSKMCAVKILIRLQMRI